METGKRRLLDAEDAERREAMKSVSFARNLKEIERNETSRIDLDSRQLRDRLQDIHVKVLAKALKSNRSVKILNLSLNGKTGAKQDPNRIRTGAEQDPNRSRAGKRSWRASHCQSPGS